MRATWIVVTRVWSVQGNEASANLYIYVYIYIYFTEPHQLAATAT